MAFRSSIHVLPLLLSLLQPRAAADIVNYNVTGYDVAPDWSKDPFPPYPPITDDHGNAIDAQNLRGTRLFGWQACEQSAVNIIKETYADFYKLSHVDGLWKNFDWNGQAAKDMWGTPTKIPNERREEIRQIYDAAKEIWYSNWQRPPWVPGVPGRDLWIEVTCSGGDDSGDPNDVCGDKPNQPSNPKCNPPKNGKDPMPGEKTNMEAYSTPDDGYSRITFCKRFFTHLRSLGDVTNDIKRQRPEVQDHLDQWNNRARTFFHEITHLNYFMNAPKKSPLVDDALISYKSEGHNVETGAYGPYNVKVLRKFRADAWYPGQNADTYAWYAMAMWAQNEIGRYPPLPAIGGKYPRKPPRRGDGSSFNTPATESFEDLGPEEIENEPVEGFTIPGCSDKMDIQDKQVPVIEANCVNDASKVPNNIFSSDSNKVYKDFCGGTVNNRKTLQWKADVHGNLENSAPHRRMLLKRQSASLSHRDEDLEKFKDFKFKLDWVPNKPYNPEDCYINCETAFSVLAKTPQCSQKGDSKNLMSKSGQIKAGCGIFGYTIEDKAESPPPPTTAPQPEPPKKTQALSVIFQNYVDEASNTNSWLFFRTDIGVSKLCERDNKALLKVNAKNNDPGLYEHPGWPGGTYPLKIDGTDCKYMNDGTNVGALFCDGRKDPIECKEDGQNKGKGKQCDSGLWAIHQHPVVFCEW
ncbi:hypothetical protein CC80DRAFT_436156 [Byssothecium circinans]|uniref:Lysine-specific metallo-endopeptidase domain-containing protein n=1 Tax=Byssothecium circinans TaxID=147558 RepID=A0A6A5UBV8_9PLEO|nr:hypothetical protein CC80DRAFT_436156 [Byssothecium circinans]